ncbi:hypothetical protein K9M48_05150 [Candidatus Gracilibacteria bacterium]|nr:hypothetical protein [Candidatus Gracilibacteria bacterium]
MQLFKRILLSLFPDEMMKNNINPASMFISFISAKEFFSVINRKIIENYKLNLFDISIDPFEFKIGFGNKQQFNPKVIDAYYGYCSTANINGYRFFNPANTSNSIALISSIYTKDIFSKYPKEYFLNFIYSVYLLSFVFLARIKKFPQKTEQEKYNRFIDTFLSFYKFVLEQTGKNIDQKAYSQIKKSLLGQIDLFFLLFHYYQNINGLLQNDKVSDNEFLEWIFYDELKNEDKKTHILNFIKTHKEQSEKSNFGSLEKSVLQYILPVDILLKYLFSENDINLVIDNIVSKIFDKKILDPFIKNIRKNPETLEDLLNYTLDYKNFKKNFFNGVQKYIVNIFKNSPNGTDEEIEDFMSSIGEDIDNIESLKIPERIKKESRIMEKILNFYITYVGGLRISRGDNFFIRMFRKDLIKDILNTKAGEEKDTSINYYGSMLYQYGKNVFYYKYTTENLRLGKQKFFLPYKSDSKKIYSNLCILNLFDENFISTIFQDINDKDIKIYIKNQYIINDFKKIFSKDISILVKKNGDKFIDKTYGDLSKLLNNPKSFIKNLNKNLLKKDIYQIKESLYCLDFWIFKDICTNLNKSNINLKNSYSDTIILGILASIRETIFGFILIDRYFKNKNIDNKILIDLYLSQIINIDSKYKKVFENILKGMIITYGEIIEKRIEIDDNKEILGLILDNRMKFTDKKTTKDIIKSISGEDIIRFKGLLKNMYYYNKRYIIPN